MGSKSNVEGCCITFGPWGNLQGKEWTYRPRGFIRTIVVKYGNCVISIAFQTIGSNGETESSIFGGRSGAFTDKISFDGLDEYLLSVSGTLGAGYFGYSVVTSICFKANKKCYGPYGATSGTAFSCACKNMVIVGFHGREDNYHLTAIGVYMMPESLAFSKSSKKKQNTKHEVSTSMPRMVIPRDAGPWGASGGNPWDDGLFSTIKQVHIHLGELNMIYALQFEYLKKDGKSVLSQIHGGIVSSKVQLVDLDVKDDEYLIGISGYYGLVKGYNELEAIGSITFHTNKRIRGPYGHERGVGHVYYTSTTSPGKVVGFHGRDKGCLSAIGVHMKYF